VDLLSALGRGLVIGFVIAAAIGPISLLCIRRTLIEGAAVGAVSGLGAATAESLYASVAAFGLTALSDVLVGARRPLGVVGGCFLLALAVHSLRTRAQAAPDRPPRTLLSAYATTLGLTIANPATILSFAAAFVGLGLAGHDAPAAAALVVGVFSGSATWWLILARVVATFRDRLGPGSMGRLAAGSAVLIGLLGLVAIGASLTA
jgi:threonine/homoserine/homoserine lactone efflux protein